MQFVLKSATPPGTQLQAVREAMRRIEPNAGLEVSTVYSSIGFAFLPSQVGAALLGSIGALGLLLAAIGLYGVMVYSVTRRRREIGVRMALGAGQRDVGRMVLASAAKLVAAGSAIGLFGSFFFTRPLAMFLVPGLHPTDPLTFVAVAVLLAVTGLLAAWSPARRAAALDPMTYLLLALDAGRQHRPPGSSRRVCSRPRQPDVGILRHRLNPVGDSIESCARFTR